MVRVSDKTGLKSTMNLDKEVEVKLTDEEVRFIKFQLLSSGLTLMNLNDKDVNAMFTQTKRNIIRNAIKRGKTSRKKSNRLSTSNAVVVPKSSRSSKSSKAIGGSVEVGN